MDRWSSWTGGAHRNVELIDRLGLYLQVELIDMWSL